MPNLNVLEARQSEVEQVADLAQRSFESPNNDEIKTALNKYRVYANDLVSRKFSPSEIPAAVLRNMGVNLGTNNIRELLQGKPTIADFDLTQGGIVNRNYMQIQLFREADRTVSTEVKHPRATPEYLDPKYALDFTQEDRVRLATGQPLGRLVKTEAPHYGTMEYCFAGFDPRMNTLALVPRQEVTESKYILGGYADPTQLAEIMRGGAARIENCKQYGDEFGANVYYDPVTREFVADEKSKVYKEPHLHPFFAKQLSPDELNKFRSGQAINARHIKNKKGECPFMTLQVNRNNNQGYFSYQNQALRQSYVQAQEQKQGLGPKI